MNNGDLPAIPNGTTEPGDGCSYDALEALPKSSWGVTKRELFAAMAMQGLLSTYNRQKPIREKDGEYTAQYAVAHADALLAELEKK